MSELGKTLGKLVDKQNLADEKAIKKSDINTWFQTNMYKVKIQSTNIVIETRDDSNLFILDHPDYGILDTSSMSAEGSFVTQETITADTSITDVGRLQFAKWLNGETPNQMKYIAWGTDDTAYDVSQTSLGAELRRVESTNSALSGVGQVQLQAEFYAFYTPTGTAKEVGVFDALSGGNMLHRSVINDLPINASTRLRVTYTFTVTDETDISSSIITNNGLNHFADWIASNATVFNATGWSDGKTEPNATDTNLDGDNVQKNAIDKRRRDGYKVEIVTNLTTAQHNTYPMGKVGNFETT